jgi:phosphoribosylaminoimidazole-succinocarboxamide synthase
MANGFQGLDGEVVPEMTDEFVQSVTDRYVELYEHIAGEEFVKGDNADRLEVMEANIKNMLARL